MASTQAYVNFILDQLSGLEEVTYRKMMRSTSSTTGGKL